ncbi:hypothetical protein GMOD_00004451 [Pyrenophora seminiperda CCB06]|uniref:Uncharacterized protein n=1 Tax=Pyrenophora seminiperda CCB06 TaxID=1302712 RepID=A0A3M7M1A8_9PLEO|nr:hypothetical protein GMOD_00004451 [Pyrenophora seminiperda CCB06]
MTLPCAPDAPNSSPASPSETHVHDHSASTLSQTDVQAPLKATKRRRKAKKHHLKFLRPTQNRDQPATSTFPYLRLPAEIRLLIASYALTSPTGSLHYNPSSMCFDVSSIGVGLIATCHEIALETQYLHLSLNRLVFEAMDNFLPSMDTYTVILALDGLAYTYGRRFRWEGQRKGERLVEGSVGCVCRRLFCASTR